MKNVIDEQTQEVDINMLGTSRFNESDITLEKENKKLSLQLDKIGQTMKDYRIRELKQPRD